MAITEDTTGGLEKIKWTWTCTSAGDYVGTSTNRFNGVAIEFQTSPASGGDAPTTLYDITITDDDGFDLLHGIGADRSATVKEYKKNADGLGCCKSSKLTLTVANAGDIKQGTVVLYLLDSDKGVRG